MALREIASSSSSPELHVLAVDDSFVDRKVIERLLKISACKGKRQNRCCLRFLLFFCLVSDFVGFFFI